MTAPRRLTCCCCDGDAGRWLQWWNRDHGFGICAPCVARQRKDGTPEEEIIDHYGREGEHWGEAPEPKPFVIGAGLRGWTTTFRFGQD